MVRINLLPVKVSRKKEAGKQQLVLFAVLLVAGLIGNFIWASQRAGVLKEAKEAVARKKAEIAQLERIIGEVKNIRAQQEELKKKLDVLDKLKAGRTGPVRMLDELATLMPKRLWLKKMDEKGGATVTFEGTAASIDDVSSFMAALKTSKHFRAVELKKTTAKSAKTSAGSNLRLVDFTITAGVTYSGEPPPGQASAPAAGGAAPAPAPVKR
ncbi:MAG TPA: PilN domain-containing protein [Anaeromyxobacteraceae bacterium]|nr:PilN domain-containing protein [Anaeromyxobacteraceae bacterium]